MSDSNLYALGNPNAHRNLNGTTAEQEAYARDELSAALVDDNVILDAYKEDDIIESFNKGEGAPGAVSSDMSVSHNSLDVSEDDLDPAALYSLIEEAIPRQIDATRVLTVAEQQQKREMLEHVWDRVRLWLRRHSLAEERQAAACIRGQADATPLHLMCKLHNPPEDVIQEIVESAPEVVGWTDNHGWLPLHHACANGTSTEVLRLLTDAYPAGKVHQDKQNRTPLHFYATRNSDIPVVMTANAALLADSGAAELSDHGGMLPMHYACAYGTHPVVLQVLGTVFPGSLVAKENKGRTPMHLAMVNAHRDSSPGVISFLLHEHAASKATINTRDNDGYLPLHLLALGLRGYRADDPAKRSNVSESLSMYLDAEPISAADFLTAIQDLPDWLQDTAVVSRHVRNVLNRKIVQRLPTSILMLDGYWLIVIIVCFEVTTRNHIDLRFDKDGGYTDDSEVALFILFCGAGYFFMREFVQVISLMSLGSLSKWWVDPANWLDMGVIILVSYFGVLMVDDSWGLDNTSFRSGAAFTKGVLWTAVIVYLKSTLVDFAVFVGGVFYVVQRLAAFLIAVSVILLAFAQMFYFVYLETDICKLALIEGDEDYDPSLSCRFPHCTFEESLLKVYTMMMGEIGDETRYSTSLTAQILFVGYAFLVVILLSNVLIAIVTDSYEIIQNDRAAIVFWSNRLDFVAEMDSITYGIEQRLRGCFGKPKLIPGFPESPSGSGLMDEPTSGNNRQTEMFREAWQQIIFLFDANNYDEIDLLEFWVYMFFRIFSILFLIPLWLALGFVTAGWLWPPQVREYLFVQKETVASRSELEKRKLGKLKAIQTDLKTLKQHLTREMEGDRDEMIRVKAELEIVQSEVLTDLQQVKELMASLLGE